MVQNAAYYVFTRAEDGSFEAFPVDAQYRFTPVIKYRTLTADEAEEEFLLRNKTINYFSLMVKKRLTDTEGKTGDEEVAIPKVKSKVDKLVRCFFIHLLKCLPYIASGEGDTSRRYANIRIWYLVVFCQVQ
jgi:uncharacterized protein YnzC (UPF0291/DUF896 family)